jgi:hypothetical protein
VTYGYQLFSQLGHLRAKIGPGIEIEIIYNNTGKLYRLLSIGPLYLAI